MPIRNTLIILSEWLLSIALTKFFLIDDPFKPHYTTLIICPSRRKAKKSFSFLSFFERLWFDRWKLFGIYEDTGFF